MALMHGQPRYLPTYLSEPQQHRPPPPVLVDEAQQEPCVLVSGLKLHRGTHMQRGKGRNSQDPSRVKHQCVKDATARKQTVQG
jgi:hypothetical protein